MQGARTSCKYHPVTCLGRGGMAEVELVIFKGDQGLRKLLVLKRLHPNLADEPECLAMLLQEARIAAQLHHPNLIHTYEVGEDEHGPYLAMEYLHGQSYAMALSRLDKGPMGVLFSLQVLIAALRGLEYAHELRDRDGEPLQLVHRDVSPPNVFITYDSQVKVLDFGIAKTQGSVVNTTAGTLKGKLRYMAPEQARGGTADRRTDLYAVGVMLWEAVAGKRRWTGYSDVSIVTELAAGVAPQSPGAQSRGLPPVLDAICLRALAPDPDQRYPSAAALRKDLEAVLAASKLDVSTEGLGPRLRQLFRKEAEIVEQLIRTGFSQSRSEPWEQPRPLVQIPSARHYVSAASTDVPKLPAEISEQQTVSFKTHPRAIQDSKPGDLK